MTLINTLAPLFALIAIGFVMVRTGHIAGEAVQPLGALVMRLALPALIFLALAGTPPGEALDIWFLLAYAAGSLAAMAVCMALARWALGLPWQVAAVVGLGVSMANSGFMSFPIAQALMGPEPGTVLLAHCMIVENLVVLPLALVLIALAQARDSRETGWDVLAAIPRNPLMLALMAGALVSFSGLALPSVAQTTLELLARISAPLALLVIGGMLAGLPAGGRAGTVILIVAGKLGLHPLAVWLALSVLPGVSPVLAVGGVLFAAMPMITIYPLLSARAGHARLGAVALLVATLGSFITLPAIIILLGLA